MQGIQFREVDNPQTYTVAGVRSKNALDTTDEVLSIGMKPEIGTLVCLSSWRKEDTNDPENQLRSSELTWQTYKASEGECVARFDASEVVV